MEQKDRVRQGQPGGLPMRWIFCWPPYEVDFLPAYVVDFFCLPACELVDKWKSKHLFVRTLHFRNQMVPICQP